MQIGVRASAALAGVASAAVALGLAEVVAVGTGARTAPLVAVGGAVIDAVPEPVKAFAIAVFGQYDKIALLTGMIVVLVALAAGVGVAALRGIWFGLAGIAVLGLLGAIAAITRYDVGAAAVLPSLVGALVGGALLWWLLHRPAAPGAGDAAPGAGDAAPGAGDAAAPGAGERRRFLQVAGAALAAGVLGGLGGRWLAARRGVSAERAEVALPGPASPVPPLPAEADFRVPGLTPYVTANDTFYRIDTALVVPQVSARTWTLRVHGRVRRPLTLTFDQLLARPMIERYVTLTCVSNEIGGELVGNAKWLGVPLKDLLDEVGPEDGADQVVSRSVDGFTAGSPTEALRDGRDAMLAVAMNGEPLPVLHGYPVRMVVPGLYGYVSATKWLAELELTSFDAYDAYWVPRGWARQAPVKTGSRIDTPRGSRPVPAGDVVVAGVAWAQRRGVSRVEVRVDDGPWQEATLSAVPSIDTWRQWRWTWPASPGRHRLRVRATDNAGETQTEESRDTLPDGATGWHFVDVTVT